MEQGGQFVLAIYDPIIEEAEISRSHAKEHLRMSNSQGRVTPARHLDFSSSGQRPSD